MVRTAETAGPQHGVDASRESERVMTIDRQQEIRRRIVAPFLDLSDMFSKSDLRQLNRPWDAKSNVGERAGPGPAERQRIARIQRTLALPDRDRRRKAN